MLHATSSARPSRPRPSGTEKPLPLASIRQALRTADMIAGKSASELSPPVEITEDWPERLREELAAGLAHIEQLLARR
jgi:hypothetical protein